ncbi:hypothetical protein [Pectobacterium sp. B1J-3]|uniref:hypothetical protein n=1 Tax=Pectobacterium sp. B1J-3 TaxID=3385371 RepID=UPI0039069DE3
MKKYLGVFMLALWLSGCDSGEKFYLIDKIHLEFDNSEEVMTKEELSVIQQGIAKRAVDSKDGIYFSFISDQGFYYIDGEKYDAGLKDGRMKFNDILLTVKKDEKDTISLVSDKKTNCDFFDCEISMTLKQVEEKSPEFVKMKQHIDEKKKAE